MENLKVAILEDDMDLLKELIYNLKQLGIIDVVVWATNSNEFKEKIANCVVDALFLDINLNNDSKTGIDVANLSELPVLFLTGKTSEFYPIIESLNNEKTQRIVEIITKPITFEKLSNRLPKFINQIKSQINSKYIFLDFINSKRNKIELNHIVCLETDTGNNGASSNKIIYFENRRPEKLIDFSYSKMEEKGLNHNDFVTPHKSYRININKLICYNNNHTLDLKVMNTEGKIETKQIPVSENYRNIFRKSL